MGYEIPTSVPATLNSGDTIKWTIADLSSFPNSQGWVLSYVLVKSDKNIDIVTSFDGTDHVVNISPLDSSAWPAGSYRYVAYVNDGTDRHIVDQGAIEIKPNIEALVSGYDHRSHWTVVLENVEAVIQGRATKDQSSYTINGRQLSRTPITDLLVLYDKAKAAVTAEEREERINKGLGHSGNIKLRM